MSNDRPPKGGWLGPPPTGGVPAVAIASGTKRGQWVWKPTKLTDKQKEKRLKFEKKMKKADSKGKWRF
jgi:hypothetical protein